MNDKLIIDGKEIKLSKETVDNIKKSLGIDETVHDKYKDFVGRWDDNLCIKGENYLKSHKMDDLYLSFSKNFKERYTDKLSGELVNISNLKPGDVIDIYPEKDDKKLDHFGVFKGVTCDKDNIFQIIGKCLDMEIIGIDYIINDKKVFRFNR